jgi:hypothetical protein
VPLNAYYQYGPPSFRPYAPECVERLYEKWSSDGISLL